MVVSEGIVQTKHGTESKGLMSDNSNDGEEKGEGKEQENEKARCGTKRKRAALGEKEEMVHWESCHDKRCMKWRSMSHDLSNTFGCEEGKQIFFCGRLRSGNCSKTCDECEQSTCTCPCGSSGEDDESCGKDRLKCTCPCVLCKTPKNKCVCVYDESSQTFKVPSKKR